MNAAHHAAVAAAACGSGRRRPRDPAARVLAGILYLTLAAVLATAGIVRPRAQSLASTLGALTQRADAVVLARVMAVRADGAGNREVVFSVRGLLGPAAPGTPARPGATFTLSEPEGEACGRALHRLAVGQGIVVFLAAAGPGTGAGVHLPVADARSLLVPTPEVVGHVRALRAAADGLSRIVVLVDGLDSSDHRIAGDAALALSIAPGLERAVGRTPWLRGRIAGALAPTLARDAQAGAALLRVAERLELDEAREPVLVTLTAPQRLRPGSVRPPEVRGLRRVLFTTLARLDPDRRWLAARLRGGAPPTTSAGVRRRLAEVLAAACSEDPDRRDARAALVALAGPDRLLRARTAATLLASGVEAGEVVAALDAESVAGARAGALPFGLRGARTERFRAIRPHRDGAGTR